MYYIYKIENLVNHKKYIGLTNNIARRKCRHFGDLKRGVHDNQFLQKEYNIYGLEDSAYENIRVDKAISDLFRENGFNEKSYNSKIIEVFETSDFVYCAIAIAWIECGELQTYNIPIYHE